MDSTGRLEAEDTGQCKADEEESRTKAKMEENNKQSKQYKATRNAEGDVDSVLDVVSVLNLQETAKETIAATTRKLEQFNLRSKVLFSKEDSCFIFHCAWLFIKWLFSALQV